ncbi:hypothetical protein [uncultured Chryseobacterium sp.]|uniref:hypothetical protein n=1 Tax=uncultured Chryseobacterium sp. TaxID=259322 RepID=UPI0025ED5760|nr:hypothetical protein [uncultured Chryseobacterium sp.]
MTLLIIFIGIAIVYYLFQKSRINRIEKQEYLREKKDEKFEQLLDLARNRMRQNLKPTILTTIRRIDL